MMRGLTTIPYILWCLSVLVTLVPAPVPVYDPNCFPVADVIFLVDGSDSISVEEFSDQRDFITRFVNESDIQPSKIRVGYIVVSSTIGDSLKLANSWTKTEVLSNVSKMTQQQEGTRTDLGLVQMEQIFMSEGRKDAIHIGVILTDGRAKYEKATRGEAAVVKNTGTFLIAVGVGRLINDAELKRIASTHGNAYRLRPIDLSVRLLEETVKFLGKEWCTVDASRRTQVHSTTRVLSVVSDTATPVIEPASSATSAPSPLPTEITTSTAAPTYHLTDSTAPTTTTVTVAPTTQARPQSSEIMTLFDIRTLMKDKSQWKKPKGGMLAFKLFDIDIPLNVPFNYVQHKASVEPKYKPWSDKTPSVNVDIQNPEMPKTTAEQQCMKSRYVDGVGYTFHPNSCSKFLQCIYVGGKLQVNTVSCPFLTWFDEKSLVCRPYDQGSCWRDPCFDYTVQSYEQQGECRAYWSCDSGLSKPHCCRERFSYSPGQGCVPDQNCTGPCADSKNWMGMPVQGVCRLAPMPTSDRHFFEYARGFGYVIRMCPYGSLYSRALCKCEATDVPAEPLQKVCRPAIHLDFTHGAHDKSGNNLALTSQNLQVESSVGEFDGTSSLKVWRFSGVSFYKQITITFVFRPRATAAHGLMMYLLGNCCHGCSNTITSPSVTVGVIPDITGGVAVFGAYTDDKEEFLNIPYTNTNDGWVRMKFNYNGSLLSGTVNGATGDKPLTGDIQSRSEPLTLGTCAGGSSFTGYIDDFKMYLCV